MGGTSTLNPLADQYTEEMNTASKHEPQYNKTFNDCLDSVNNAIDGILHITNIPSADIELSEDFKKEIKKLKKITAKYDQRGTEDRAPKELTPGEYINYVTSVKNSSKDFITDSIDYTEREKISDLIIKLNELIESCENIFKIKVDNSTPKRGSLIYRFFGKKSMDSLSSDNPICENRGTDRDTNLPTDENGDEDHEKGTTYSSNPLFGSDVSTNPRI